jgi:hypothetical protein
VGVVFLYVVFQATQVYELSDARAMDEAQVARNLSRGEGFTTLLLRPLTLAKVPQIEGHPDLVNAPLHPLFMSLLFRALGPTTRVASWASGIPFLLTIPLVFWLGARAFSRKVAVLAVLAVASNLGLLTVASAGTHIALLSLWFTVLAIVLVRLQEGEPRRGLWTVAAAAVCALLYLTDYLYLAVALPVVVLVAALVPVRRRAVAVLTFGVVFGVVCSPWWVRNFLVVRSPFYTASSYETMMGTRTHAGNTLYRDMNPAPESLAAFALKNPRELYEKARDAAMTLTPAVFTIAGVVMTPFFLVAIMIPLGHVALDRLRLVLYAALVLLALGTLMVVPDSARLLPVVPIVTLVAAAFFYQLLDLRLRPLPERLKERWSAVALTLLLLCHGLPVLLLLAPGRAADTGQPARLRRACQEANNLTQQYSGGLRTPRQDPVYTDVPWAVAWYADRPAVWLPTTMVDVRRAEQQGGPIRWLLLTPQILLVQEAEKAEYWGQLWRSGLSEAIVSDGWRVRQRLTDPNWLLLERIPELASVDALETDGGRSPRSRP